MIEAVKLQGDLGGVFDCMALLHRVADECQDEELWDHCERDKAYWKLCVNEKYLFVLLSIDSFRESIVH